MNFSNSTPKISPLIRNNDSAAKRWSQSEQVLQKKIFVSNVKSKFRLEHGDQFKDMLDQRDKVLEHFFDFMIQIDEHQLQSRGILNTDAYKSLLSKIKIFLREGVSNIISISFRSYCKGDLQEKEPMEYASKNIMLNIHSIFKETLIGLKDYFQKEQNIGHINFNKIQKELSEDLLHQLDNILHNILINLADSYPQAPVVGGTPRMREVITEVDRTEDEQNDFIYACGIKISDYLQIENKGIYQGQQTQTILFGDDCDYTPYIMKVINAAIEVTQSTFNDHKERTIFEKFSEFNQHLIHLTQNKNSEKLFHHVQKPQNSENMMKKGEIETGICDKFNSILSSSRIDRQSKLEEKVNNLWKCSWDMVNELKDGKKFVVGQKIPSSILPFSRQEISNKKFESKHASILRILTKWASYLEEKLKDPQKFIRNRVYSFKNIHNQLVMIDDQTQRTEIIKHLSSQYKQVEKKFSHIQSLSNEFIAKFLGPQTKNEQFISNICRFTQTRTVSSKINAVLTSLMLNYTNILIDSLLKVGNKINIYGEEDGEFKLEVQNLSLIKFRVGDLLRSKVQSNENGFINILKTMYILDKNEKMHDKFKLVRIKNKLDQPANNIIINYLFMGKVQCELQLSIQNIKGKEKKYYSFSHFIYQLTRGRFGSIAELAIMISQLDPMIAACKDVYYKEKNQPLSLLKQQSQQNLEESIDIGNNKNQDCQNLFSIFSNLFFCVKCSKFVKNENICNIVAKEYSSYCYNCIFSESPVEKMKENQKKIFKSIKNKQMNNYSELEHMQKQKYLLCLTENGQFALHIVIHISRGSKTLKLKVDKNLIESISSSTVSFDNIQYTDITDEVKKHSKNKGVPAYLSYKFDEISEIPQEIIEKIHFKSLFIDKLKKIIPVFKQYALEKNLVKAIKYKTEILKLSQEEACIFDRIGQIKIDSNKVDDGKEQKYQNLDFSNLKQIKIPDIGLFKIPQWMKLCTNIKKLVLINNSVSQIKANELPQSLTFLKLTNNQIADIDLSSLPLLVHLKLQGNLLNSICLQNNSSLQDINLSKNKFSGQFNIGSNKNIKLFSLAFNSLTEFFVEDSNKIEQLNISNNQLTYFEMGSNNKLVELDLAYNKIKKINFENENSIEHLNIGNNLLEQLNVSDQNKIGRVNIEGNKNFRVETLPNSIKTFERKKNQSSQFYLKKLLSIDCFDSSPEKQPEERVGSRTSLFNQKGLASLFLVQKTSVPEQLHKQQDLSGQMLQAKVFECEQNLIQNKNSKTVVRWKNNIIRNSRKSF